MLATRVDANRFLAPVPPTPSPSVRPRVPAPEAVPSGAKGGPNRAHMTIMWAFSGTANVTWRGFHPAAYRRFAAKHGLRGDPRNHL